MAEIIAAWNREIPDVDASSIAVLIPLIHLAAQLNAMRDTTLRRLGINQGRLSVLGALRRSGPPYRLSAGELARQCEVTAGAITQRLDRLETAGYVTRHQNPDDRRGVSIQLTDSGQEKLDVVFRAVMRADEVLLSFLPARDREPLTAALHSWMNAACLDHTAPDFEAH
ncbi:MarR family winged helix-turn-helix transcriptional regulator [Leifsonia sp. L25]|uniref:MarR family winged helix-turn-helix transcriptional regulator n=1 Tax=Actinomycetes TaxID=1760 RepID=UPI003D68EA91